MHANRFAAGQQQPPYIPRDIDALLHDALSGDKRLRRARPRLAGCTATLAHAVLTHLPSHYRIMAFHDDPRLPLQQMIEHAAHLAARAEAVGAVLWLDGLPPERAGGLANLAMDTLPDALWIAGTLTCPPDDEQPSAARLEALLDQHAVRADLCDQPGRALHAARHPRAEGPDRYAVRDRHEPPEIGSRGRTDRVGRDAGAGRDHPPQDRGGMSAAEST